MISRRALNEVSVCRSESDSQQQFCLPPMARLESEGQLVMESLVQLPAGHHSDPSYNTTTISYELVLRGPVYNVKCCGAFCLFFLLCCFMNVAMFQYLLVRSSNSRRRHFHYP